jgi:hypothetical protein
MSKFKLAKRLVDSTGVSFSKASRFIDDVGVSDANRLIDDTVQAGQDTVARWWKPAAGAGAIAGGGALAWRQQDVAVARSLAEREQSRSDAVKDLIDSDLPPELKKELLNQLADEADDDPGASNPFDNLPLMIGGVVALLFVLNYATTAGASLGTSAGGR